MTDLITRIENLMSTDEDNRDNHDLKLTAFYENATTDDKAIIDMVVCRLCGYTLGTLIKHKEIGQ